MSETSLKTGCVALYAARIRFLSKNILQAQEFGAVSGNDNSPWETAFQQRAAVIYRDALPSDYLARLCAMFVGCSLTMGELSVPDHLAQDWLIVESYFDNASQAISMEIGVESVMPAWEDPADQEPTTPGVVRFDQLATLASEAGLQRMVASAGAVNEYLSHMTGVSDLQQGLLRDLAEGKLVVDIAADRGFSRRSLHREMTEMWSELGVANRQQGIALAAQNGWLR